ncbi:MAG: hypothetical protein HKN25_01850 [Pyrinomonadaceae bacterium]|nr:hypothetical protein [Pyrinomonadaceae bacterium]
MRIKNTVFLSLAVLVLSSISSFAQESDIQVVDEVIAQVNESVITLSQVKKEMKTVIESMVQEGKSREEATAMTENKRGQIIASLITEELLVQKGKEIGVENRVNVSVNQQLLQMMKRFNLDSLDKLYEAMRSQGVDPEDFRDYRRRQVTKELVWRSQVDERLYWDITSKEIKSYYAANKKKFTKPATVTISEIFLSFAGRDKAEVKKKAAEIVARARKGESFENLAVENSDRPNVSETKGKAGTFNVPDIDPQFAEPIKNLKVGEVSDPIEMEVGMEIIRIDKRTKGTNESHFDERAVRSAILFEKGPDARKKYMKKLQDDAYIKVRKSYQALVMPFLNPDSENKTTASK